MPYTVKQKFGDKRTIQFKYYVSDALIQEHHLETYTSMDASYSYRTGKNAGRLQLGEQRLGTNSSIADCLAAERAAIRELDAESEDNVLHCGAYSSDDAGHLFSRLKLRAGYQRIVGSSGNRWHERTRSYNCPLVDPLTNSIWRSLYAPKKYTYGISTTCGREGMSLESLLNSASHTLVDMYPDKIKGTLGQDLVDLARLPKLIKQLTDTRLLMGDLRRKWKSLSQAVRDTVDSDIKHALLNTSKSASKGMSSAALEWMFVLEPYIDDLKTIMRFLAKAEGACVQRSRRVRTSCPYRDSVFCGTPPICTNTSTGDGYLDFADGLEQVCEYDYRVTAAFRRRKPVHSFWLEKAESINRQLGIWYPSLLWDLLPWSFVVDWAVNIGDVIDASSEYEGKYHISYSYITVKGASRGFLPPLPSTPGWAYISDDETVPLMEFLSRVPLDPVRGIRPHFTNLTGEEKGIMALLGLSR